MSFKPSLFTFDLVAFSGLLLSLGFYSTQDGVMDPRECIMAALITGP
jgi:hypothetical protein